MSDLRRPVGPFCMIEAFDLRSEFNSRSEEDRYQAFKARLMDELVATSSNTFVFEINGKRLNGAPLKERMEVKK